MIKNNPRRRVNFVAHLGDIHGRGVDSFLRTGPGFPCPLCGKVERTAAGMKAHLCKSHFASGLRRKIEAERPGERVTNEDRLCSKPRGVDNIFSKVKHILQYKRDILRGQHGFHLEENSRR